MFYETVSAILAFFHSIAGLTLLKNKVSLNQSITIGKTHPTLEYFQRSLKSYNVYCYVQFCFYLIGMFTYYKWVDGTCQRRNQLLVSDFNSRASKLTFIQPLVTCYGLRVVQIQVIFIFKINVGNSRIPHRTTLKFLLEIHD